LVAYEHAVRAPVMTAPPPPLPNERRGRRCTAMLVLVSLVGLICRTRSGARLGSDR